MTMADHFWVLQKFIEEEGQEKGEVSGQMALASLEILQSTIPLWTMTKPTSPGIYLYRSVRDSFGYELLMLECGDWRKAQNPAWLYDANGKLVSDMGLGTWFGPIPFLPSAPEPEAATE